MTISSENPIKVAEFFSSRGENPNELFEGEFEVEEKLGVPQWWDRSVKVWKNKEVEKKEFQD